MRSTCIGLASPETLANRSTKRTLNRCSAVRSRGASSRLLIVVTQRSASSAVQSYEVSPRLKIVERELPAALTGFGKPQPLIVVGNKSVSRPCNVAAFETGSARSRTDFCKAIEHGSLNTATNDSTAHHPAIDQQHPVFVMTDQGQDAAVIAEPVNQRGTYHDMACRRYFLEFRIGVAA